MTKKKRRKQQQQQMKRRSSVAASLQEDVTFFYLRKMIADTDADVCSRRDSRWLVKKGACIAVRNDEALLTQIFASSY
jgi:hypothetical protein